MNKEGEITHVEEAPFFGNEMRSFDDGAQTSLQFRLAFDFVKAGLRPDVGFNAAATPEQEAQDTVTFAYQLAEELVNQGSARGHVRAITDSHEINSSTRRMIDRQVDASVYQAKSSQRAQHEMMKGAVAIPVSGANGPIHQ